MHESCGCRITAITPAFQAGDEGSTPFIRCSIHSWYSLKTVSLSVCFVRQLIYNKSYITRFYRIIVNNSSIIAKSRSFCYSERR